MEKEMQNLLIAAAKGQLFSSYQMLETLVDVCPDEIWQGVYGEVPFWYQVYHTAYFVDYCSAKTARAVAFPPLASTLAFRRSLSGFRRRMYPSPARPCASICA